MSTSIKDYRMLKVWLLSTLALVSFIGFSIFSIKYEIFSQGKVGESAVNALYNFSSLEELENNLPKLESLTTEKVYKDISVINSDKSLNTYLKFKKEPVSVKILESKPGSVLYTLESPSISSGRKFLFSYELNIYGKIDYVREMECIDFYK